MYSNFLDVLRRKGRKANTKGQEFNIGKSIKGRPFEVSTKKVFGHWELGSFSKREKQSLLCNVCGVKDKILCSNKDGRQK